MLISRAARVDVRRANNRLREGGPRRPRPPPAPRFRTFGRTHPPFVLPGPAARVATAATPPRFSAGRASPGGRGGRGEEAREEAASGGGPGAGGPGAAEAPPPPTALGEGLRAAIRPFPGPLSAGCGRTPSESSPGSRDAQPRPHLVATALRGDTGHCDPLRPVGYPPKPEGWRGRPEGVTKPRHSKGLLASPVICRRKCPWPGARVQDLSVLSSGKRQGHWP